MRDRDKPDHLLREGAVGPGLPSDRLGTVGELLVALALKPQCARELELQFLGETADWTYFVLSPGQQPDRLIAQLESYAQAPDLEGAYGPNYTFFDGVEGHVP